MGETVVEADARKGIGPIKVAIILPTVLSDETEQSRLSRLPRVPYQEKWVPDIG